MKLQWVEALNELEAEKKVLALQLTDAINKEETSYQRGERKGFWRGAIYTLTLLAIFLILSLGAKYQFWG